MGRLFIPLHISEDLLWEYWFNAPVPKEINPAKTKVALSVLKFGAKERNKNRRINRLHIGKQRILPLNISKAFASLPNFSNLLKKKSGNSRYMAHHFSVGFSKNTYFAGDEKKVIFTFNKDGSARATVPHDNYKSNSVLSREQRGSWQDIINLLSSLTHTHVLA